MANHGPYHPPTWAEERERQRLELWALLGKEWKANAVLREVDRYGLETVVPRDEYWRLARRRAMEGSTVIGIVASLNLRRKFSLAFGR